MINLKLAASVAGFSFLLALVFVLGTEVRKQRALLQALSKPVVIEGLYDPASGDVVMRINKDDQDWRVLPKLCPKSMAL